MDHARSQTYMHIPTGKRVAQAVDHVVAEHCDASRKGPTRGGGVLAGSAGSGGHGSC